MNCSDVEKRLQKHLDGEPFAPDQDLDRHLAACPACRQLEAAARRLEEGLSLVPPITPPSGLSDRLVVAVLADRRRRLRIRRGLVGACALAAVVVLALVIGQAWQPAPVPEPSPGPVAELPAPKPPPPSLSNSVNEAGTAVVALARRTGDEALGQTRLLWPETDMPTWPESWNPEPTLESSAQPLWEVSQGLTASLEPVATSARRAFDLFLRDIPPMGAGMKDPSPRDS